MCAQKNPELKNFNTKVGYQDTDPSISSMMNFLSGRSVSRFVLSEIGLLSKFRGYGCFTQKSFYSTERTQTSLGERNTGKHPLSRKTFLVDYYKYLNDSNAIILYVHHNNLVKAENKKLRSELRACGANLHIIRNSIYNVYLRSEKEEDPAEKEVSVRNRQKEHPFSALLNGPTGVISIPKCDPSVVSQVLKVLNGAGERLILMGAKVENNVYDIDQVTAFKDLPNKEQLQAQLAGLLTILGGAGLVRTLEAGSNVLYLTLDERRKDMKDNHDDDSA